MLAEHISIAQVNGAAHPSDRVAELDFNGLSHVRVVIINLPLRESARPNVPPQGPGLMAARLRQYGADVSLIDLNGYRITDKISLDQGNQYGRHLTVVESEQLITAHFNKHGEPHIIGLSGMITTQRWQAAVAKICRRIAKQAFIISGGGLATEIKGGLFDWIPELDAIGHSEGDDIILICAAEVKRSGFNRDRMCGSPAYIGTVGGQPRWIYSGDRPKNLNALPFAAWDLLEEDVNGYQLLEDYIRTPVWGLGANNSSATPFSMQRSLTTVSSRGCPHACAFCYRGAQGERNWGIRSPENLRAEAEWLIQTYGVDFIGFPDDNFAVDFKRCAALPRAFEGLNFRWGTHTRLDECTLNRLEPMAAAGCVYIGVGAESASEDTLVKMNKGGQILYKNGQKRMSRVGEFNFPTMMIEGVQNCHQLDIHVNATWMMAYPGETLRDLQVSVGFILWQQELYTKGLTVGTPAFSAAVASVNRRMFTATAYPGTAMFKDQKVQKLLTEHFGISFDRAGDPLCDIAFLQYVEELDDATKVLVGANGKPLNWSEMPDEVFLEARRHVDNDQIEKILDM